VTCQVSDHIGPSKEARSVMYSCALARTHPRRKGGWEAGVRVAHKAEEGDTKCIQVNAPSPPWRCWAWVLIETLPHLKVRQ